MATFVLVHGGCHGSWCYSRVTDILRGQSHDVFVPTLSGVGERAHLANQQINLATHVEDVVAILLSHDLRDVILCGHSYGGMVISGVAGRVAERVKTLFYIDGCVPEDGQSLFDLVGPDRTLKMLEATAETGTMMAPPPAALFQVNSADVAWVDSKCTSHPIACFIQKHRMTGKESLVANRTFVLCERYHSINHATFAKVNQTKGWKTHILDCGHDAMIDAPKELSELLLAELDIPESELVS